MKRNKNIVTGMLALVVSVIAIGLAYAGFTGTLNINGTGNVISARLRCKVCFPLAIYYRISMEPPVNPGLAKQFYHLSVMEAPERTF